MLVARAALVPVVRMAAVACGALLALTAQPTLAQSVLQKGAATAAPVQSLGERLTDVDAQLSAADSQLEQDRAGLLPVPAGATAAQLAERSQLLQRVAAQLQAQRNVLSELAAVRAARSAAEDALAAYRPGAPTVPVRLTDLDGLLDRLDAETTRRNSYQSLLLLQRTESQRVEALLQDRTAAERLARDRNADPASLEIARLQTRLAAETLRRQTAEAELTEELRRGAEARVSLLEKQADAIGDRFQFSSDELDSALTRLRSGRTALDQRAAQASAAQQAARQDLEQLRTSQSAVANATGGEIESQRARLQARVEAVEAQIEALRIELSALSTLRSGAALGEALWKQRYQVLASSSDAEARRSANQALTDLFDRTDTLRRYATDLGVLANGLMQAQQQRTERAQREGNLLPEQTQALVLARRAAAAAGEVQMLADRLAVGRTRWQRQSEEAADKRNVAQRTADVWAEVRHLASRAWNFELFSVTETVTIEGRATTIERGVTIGKSVGVIVLFLGGLWLAGFVLRKLEAMAVARAGISATQARVLRRWSMLLAGFLLLVLTLNLARIPLTVFAFMGGALAIGVGFGTQTLLKNFISGIIVLFERKVRVGDLVDVDGVQGVVTAVDIRSTTVRQFDGIETLVPNAALLENKVTNWTGETPVMRRVVRLGVAYGAPTRTVADLMTATAREHGQVLTDPAPYVLFEDFGADALIFALYFWVDVVKHSGSQVQSDIRFMLDRRLAEAGIGIAYPQRDVHLDTSKPLRVELSRAAAPAR